VITVLIAWVAELTLREQRYGIRPYCCAVHRLHKLTAAVLGVACLTFISGGSVAVATTSSDSSANAVPVIRAGIEAYNRGEYSVATTDLNQARTLIPDNSAVALYLGLAYLKEGDLKDAVVSWEKYITLKPSTDTEKSNNLQDVVSRDLTILVRVQNLQEAEIQIGHEREIGPPDIAVVAITYYRNLGSPKLAALQKGLTALVIADVSKVPNIKVVERDRMQALIDEMKLGSSGLVDQQTAARAGHLLGAGRVVTGSYFDPRQGEVLIDSTLLVAGPIPVSKPESEGGPILNFYHVEQLLSADILNDLGYPEPVLKARGLWQAVQTPQTTNYNAFEAFSRGLEAKDNQDYPKARQLFQQALVDDPSFALALQELDRTPLQAVSVSEVASSVSSLAPSEAAITASLSGEPNFRRFLPKPSTMGLITVPGPPPPPPPPPPVLPLFPSFP
jgi:tetratricopeptide (TPR) repeat protein